MLKISLAIYFIIATWVYANAEEYRDIVRHTPVVQSEGRVESVNDFGEYHALFIYVEEYRYLKKLKTPKNDAEAIANILSDRYGFKKENIKTLPNPKNAEEVIGALEDLAKRLKPEDNLLIYYAGHGSLNAITDRGYWNLVEATANSRIGSISTDEAIKVTILGMQSKHILVIADSCYAGVLTRSSRDALEGLEEGEKKLYVRKHKKYSRTVFTSGGEEPVLDRDVLDRSHSIFAKRFMVMLEENEAPLFALNEKYKDIATYIVGNSEQTPEYTQIRDTGHESDGDFIFLDYKSIYKHKDNPIEDIGIDKKSKIVNAASKSILEINSVSLKEGNYILWALVAVTVLLCMLLIVYLKSRKHVRAVTVKAVKPNVEVKTVVKKQIKGTFSEDSKLYENHFFDKQYTWGDAKEYAKTLRHGGFDDWRLPTREELRVLGNITLYGEYDVFWEEWYSKNKDRAELNRKGKKHFIQSEFLENMPNDSWFWTMEAKDEDDIWRVGFHLGCSDVCYDEDMSYVLCVREIKEEDNR